jgi:hypothetical protein
MPSSSRASPEPAAQVAAFTLLLILALQFGTLPAELTRKNMEIYANEVMPYLRDKVPAVEAAE